MERHTRLSSRLAAVLIAFGAGLAVAQAAALGDPAPALELREFVKGEPFTLSHVKGKKILVLHFWATQCPACDKALPALNETVRKFASRGVAFLAVASDDPAAVRKAPQLKEMNLPVATDDMVKTADAYLSRGDKLPTDVIIGKDGRILWTGPSIAMPAVLADIVENRYNFAEAQSQDRFSRGMVEAERKGDHKKALSLLDERLKTRPDDAELIAMRTNVLARHLNAPEQALADISKAIERNPHEFKLHETRLNLLLFRKITGKPMQTCYQVIANEFPDRPMLLVMLAENLMRQPVGDYQLRSVFALTRAAYQKGNFTAPREKARAAAALARAYYYVGMLDHAVRYQKEALAAIRNAPEAKIIRRDLLYYQNARVFADELRAEEK